MKHHYVYYSYEEFGRGYIGSRSSVLPPEIDPYLGSYQDKTFNPSNKIILFEGSNRKEVNKVEMELQLFFEVVENPHFANKSVQTSSSFSTEGLKMSEEWKQKRSEYAKKTCPFNRPDLREANNLRMRENNPMKNPDTVVKVMSSRRTYEGSDNPNVKLTREQCVRIREMKTTGKFTNFELSTMFGVSVPTIKRVNRPDHWSN